MTDQWTGRWLAALEHPPWRAAVAHGAHEKRIGETDANWSDCYADCMVRAQSGVGTARVVRSLTSVASMVGGRPRLAQPGAIALAHPSRVLMSLDDCRLATGARSIRPWLARPSPWDACGCRSCRTRCAAAPAGRPWRPG